MFFELLGEDQLVLLRSSQAIDLAVILDPNFISAASQRIELDDFGKHRCRLVQLLVGAFLIAAAHHKYSKSFGLGLGGIVTQGFCVKIAIEI